MRFCKAARRAVYGWNDFTSCAGRSEFGRGINATALLAALMGISTHVLLGAVYGEAVVRDCEMTIKNCGGLLAIGLAFATICFFSLPLITRRFHDRGWGGGWFSWMHWPTYAASACFLVALLSTFFGFSTLVYSVTAIGTALIVIPYASIVCCIWIGWMKSDSSPNKYGLNPHEVTP